MEIKKGTFLAPKKIRLKTIIVKAENASDLTELLAFISRKDKQNNIVSLLRFAAHNRVFEKGYKLNRDVMPCLAFSQQRSTESKKALLINADSEGLFSFALHM